MYISETFTSLQGEGTLGRGAFVLYPNFGMQSALPVVRYALHFVAPGGHPPAGR